MFTQMKKRKYSQKKRAEKQEQTRERIVEAVMALHEELGPRDTTITAVAERAGVQRLTVYRHFPDDVALFQACSSRWFELHPAPDLQAWQGITDPSVRSLTALQDLFDYYRQTEGMWTSIYRDLDETPALQQPMEQFENYLAGIRNDLLAVWKPTGTRKRDMKITVDHCLQFSTWKSLSEQGLSDKQITNLVVRWINATMD
jgi:AcrR family transcriptional regulator